MRKIVIHKPTHLLFDGGNRLVARVQQRGGLCYINRFDEFGNLVEKSYARGLCCDHLTGHGVGIETHQDLSVESMQNAFTFTFGATRRLPVRCVPA